MNIGLARLKKEYQLSQRDPTPGILTQPDPKNWFNWHFVFYDLPTDTPYRGGVYYGELRFPLAYPNAPPDIIMHTPSGRLEVEAKICTSFSSFHPESWSPSWNVQTILKGIVSFFLSEEGGTGTTRASNVARVRYAKTSMSFNLKNDKFATLFKDTLNSLGLKWTDSKEEDLPVETSAGKELWALGVVIIVLAVIGNFAFR